jgi:hypothetical protein
LILLFCLARRLGAKTMLPFYQIAKRLIAKQGRAKREISLVRTIERDSFHKRPHFNYDFFIPERTAYFAEPTSSLQPRGARFIPSKNTAFYGAWFNWCNNCSFNSDTGNTKRSFASKYMYFLPSVVNGKSSANNGLRLEFAPILEMLTQTRCVCLRVKQKGCILKAQNEV